MPYPEALFTKPLPGASHFRIRFPQKKRETMIDWKWYPQFIGLIRDPEGKHYKKMGMAKWLFDYFCAQGDRETGEWMGGVDTISEETGIPTWNVKRYLATLKKYNYVETFRIKHGIRVKIKKFKTLVKTTTATPTAEDINVDERTPLEKNPESKLYVANSEESLEYFKKILDVAHLSNIDTYTILQMYWAKIPLAVIKSSVDEVILKSADKKIFTVKYFKKAIYENHRKLTPKLEPEETLMSDDQKKSIHEFKDVAQRVGKEVEDDEEII